MDHIKLNKISIKHDPEIDERWVQERIAEDPGILGLGDLVLKDKERQQPRAGRLDLLLQHAEESHRYEVEVQLGSTDESHLVRTLEYWDIERRRYPQYDHTAVIVAEEITARFLNVISLFNGMIPLVAVQLNAVRLDGGVGLMFTTVLDQMTLGLVDEDEEVQEVTDRAYWERRGTPKTVKIADEVLKLVKDFAPDHEFKYNKFYIGLARGGQPNNFATLRPQKNAMQLTIRLPRSDETGQRLDGAGFDVMDYDQRYGDYRVRLRKEDTKQHAEVLLDLLRAAYESSGR